MALETVVYSQDPFSYYPFKDLYTSHGSSNNDNFEYNNDHHHHHHNHNFFSLQNQEQAKFDHHRRHDNDQNNNNNNNNNIVPDENDNCTTTSDDHGLAAAAIGRQKRRRARRSKNKEELETQRMTHITVERNRRKQMNEYLAVLRSLLPPSYVQRGDQASIIGGAINFVKELEQLLLSMENNNKRKSHDHDQNHDDQGLVLAEFLTFPQYTAHGNVSTKYSTVQASESQNQEIDSNNNNNNNNNNDNQLLAAADIEVTIVETHASLKIRAKKRPKQLLRIVAGLQCLRLEILHLNVTTAGKMALYSVSLKIEDGCQLNTVDEIAMAVNQMLHRIQEESLLSSETETV